MKDYLTILKKSQLFEGIKNEDLAAILNCLAAKTKAFAKGATIFREGEQAQNLAILLEGEVQTQKTDYNGNENIISKLYAADIVAASACYSSDQKIPFDAVCNSDCQIMYLDTGKIISPCAHSCAFHTRLIQNMLSLIADRNILLAQKITVLTKRTIREKVLEYLLTIARKSNSQTFTIPLSRRQMAEYLSVNRSALSRELCNLRDEGLLKFSNNAFFIKKQDNF